MGHHLVGNARKVGNKIGDITLRIDQGRKFVNDRESIVHQDADFGDFGVFGTSARGLYVNNGKQCRKDTGLPASGQTWRLAAPAF